jgi:chemotaxis protein MotA
MQTKVLAILGIVLVFVAVLGGFLLERGNPYILMQPAELLIVGGAAVGITVVANPPRTIVKMWQGLRLILRAPSYTREKFLTYLRMLYETFGYTQRAGVMGLERDVEDPAQSRIFSRYPGFLSDQPVRAFLCDSLRMMVIGVTTAHELDQLMNVDIEVQRRGRREPVSALSAIADSLPGLGIVAAVLGVVITMEAIGGSPELVGQKVAAALVGTFLGILLCYGVVGPAAQRMENLAEQHAEFLQVMRTAVASFARGASPILAVEYARRSIPVDLRPSFVDLETTIRRDARIPAAPKPGGTEDASAESIPA